MAKRNDIKKIMVIGSGPIVIGQAAEFDYAGTQACLALKEEGYEVILVNSNPATIMTDKEVASKVYMEPLTIEYVSKIMRKERPDAIMPGLGGQTGLNLVVELAQKGVLEECQVEILGTKLEAIQQAEDRELFKQMCIGIDEPIIESKIAMNVSDCVKFANEIGYPIVLRPAFTLGGTGGGFVYNDEECFKLATSALSLSPAHQVLVEKSLLGYQEIEFEVMRDKSDHAMIICDMENIDPVGVHTGDSCVVAPTQSLSNEVLTMLADSAKKIIRTLKIEGGCNVQYALKPDTKDYFLIEVNPRVSRSSALASKATSYPIAYVTSKIAVGYNLNEIAIIDSNASIEPKVDYTVVKMSRFPFDKFKGADRKLSTQMKATGEIMALGKSYEEAFLKAIRSMENGYEYLTYQPKANEDGASLLKRIVECDDERLYIIGHLLRNGISIDQISDATKITRMFIEKMANIINYEKEIVFTKESILKAKQLGFSDKVIAGLLNKEIEAVRNFRKDNKILPYFQMVDAMAINDEVSYLYSTYHVAKENKETTNKKVIIIGSGPIRIGQGIEFDYSTVHCIKTIKALGIEAIVINNNPETVSTDYTVSDKLYFEPITIEEVMNIIDVEKPYGVIVQLGGQTAINLTKDLSLAGVNILGTSFEAIELAENRDLFEKLLKENDIKQPQGKAISDIQEGLDTAKIIGYPLLVRPSFVLGGQSMRIVNDDDSLVKYLSDIVEVNSDKPVLMDKYIKGKEVELDAICDGKDVFIPGIMEHIERTGVHSGDSISVYPNFSLSQNVIDQILKITTKVGLALKTIGLFNIQYIVDSNEDVYIIEVNPRASRSIPFISKVCDVNLSAIATKVMLGYTLEQLDINPGLMPVTTKKFFVKTPTFSFSKIKGLDTNLGPEMKSTGEAIGYDTTLNKALYKALQASGMKIKDYGTVFITVADEDKKEVLELAQRFYELGFNIVATKNTGAYLIENNIKAKILPKLSEGSDIILDWIKKDYIKYIVNTQSLHTTDNNQSDGYIIRTSAALNNITTFTSLDTVKVLLGVLEERGIKVATI